MSLTAHERTLHRGRVSVIDRSAGARRWSLWRQRLAHMLSASGRSLFLVLQSGTERATTVPRSATPAAYRSLHEGSAAAVLLASAVRGGRDRLSEVTA